MAEETANPTQETDDSAQAPPTVTAELGASVSLTGFQIAPEAAIERIEAAAEEAIAALTVVPVDAGQKVAQLHQHIDTFWADLVRNLGPVLPTNAQNQLNDLKETLRSKLVSLF